MKRPLFQSYNSNYNKIIFNHLIHGCTRAENLQALYTWQIEEGLVMCKSRVRGDDSGFFCCVGEMR